MSRRIKVFVLCEDIQSATLIRQYLELRGFHRRAIRVDKFAAGCGFDRVKSRYPDAVRVNRTRAVAEALVVHIDADDLSVAQRHSELAARLQAAELDPRGPNEPIAIVVPRRETETWLHHFRQRAHVVEYPDKYPHFERQTDAATPTAQALLACVNGAAAPANLPSFATAVAELRRLP